MHGRMDSDDEESGDAEKSEEDVVNDVADAEPFIESNLSSKVGSDAVEVDPENDPIRVVSRRVLHSKNAASPAAAAVPAPKKNVKSMTLAERLLLDKKVNDGQRVEVICRSSLFDSFPLSENVNIFVQVFCHHMPRIGCSSS
jgi:hypothetical protein